jgi:hypothetical protein
MNSSTLPPQYALPSKQRHNSLYWGKASVPTCRVQAAKTQEKVKSQERATIKPAAKSNHVNAASVWGENSYEPASSAKQQAAQNSRKQDLFVELYK